MGKCDNCRLRKESAKAFDIHWHGEDDCPYGKCPVPDFPKTNADRIRAMSDEELAMLIHDIVQAEMWRAQVRECITTETGWLDWLREEVSTDG